MREELAKIIKEKREKISDSSVRTYVSLLTNLNLKLNGGKDNYLSFFHNNASKIIEYIEGLKSNQSKKTLYSALFIVTGLEQYHAQMLENASKVNEFYKQQKTLEHREEQKKTSVEQLRAKYDEYLAILQKNPTIENYINYFVVAFTSCKIMNPRRNLDWISIKIKNINKEEDNYIDSKGYFIFNKFKTAKYHEKDSLERRVPVPKELLARIKKFSKISDNDYLLYHEKNGLPFTSSYFSKKLQQIYGEGITTDVIRSIFISNIYKDLPALQQLEDIASSMGTSINASLGFYVKKDT